ncbi:MAG: GNAT family N-acetyltransferase [Ktedonobacteraceae bacterium]|nr:GNAT family N-acetyltransferase [Ktedonobacteraceae bacterium]
MLTSASPAAADYRRDLGDGLVLRWSTAADTEHLAELTSLVFRDKADDPPNDYLPHEIRRLMRGDHPVMGPGDYGLVEDTRKEGNPVVACVCLQRLTWQYEDIPFRIGRPEIVATDPAYRNRGLIRKIFEMVHARSEAEGHLVQAITGIPYFYRQFGYEFALDLGGRRVVFNQLIPKLKDGESEPYTLREATVEDIPLLQRCYNRRQPDNLVWTEAPDYYWRYHIENWKTSSEHDKTVSFQVILDANGTPVGALHAAVKRRSRELGVWNFDVVPGINLQAVLPSVLRALLAYGSQLPTSKPDIEPFSAIAFRLGRQHPVYELLGSGLAPYQDPPYSWYVRVPNLPAFLTHIAPVLEKRLAGSDIAGYSGEIKLDFYRGGPHGGLRMAFENGKLHTVEHWNVPTYEGNASGGFPPLVFLQVVFGHRTLDELRRAFPDVWVDREPEFVLKTLFPVRPSNVQPLD